MNPRRLSAQRGMTLLITMIMLIVITLFVVSSVKLGSINANIVSNMRAQRTVDAEAQQQIEIALNQFSFFNDEISGTGAWASAATTSLTSTQLWASYAPAGATTAPAVQSTTLTISRPQCMYYQPATGYSALSGVAPQDTYWDVQANAADSTTGATSEIHQGVQMRLPAGNCS